MSYIIVWRHRHRDPHVGTENNASGEFLETFSSFEEALAAADGTIATEGKDSRHYFDYAIYEEVES